MRRLSLLLLILLLIFSLKSEAQAIIADYFVRNASGNAIYEEMVIHPEGIYYNGRTYLVYQGEDLDPFIISYNHTASAWSDPVRIGDNSLGSDPHGGPAILIDRAGYFHVFYGAHSTPLRHVRSGNPGDISSWTEMPPVADSATYPQPIMMSDGTIYLFFREDGHEGDWAFLTSVDNGLTWVPSGGGIPILESSLESAWYAHFEKGKGDKIHMAFVWQNETEIRETGNYFARYNVYYAYRDENGYWRNISGEVLDTPITKNTADEECLVYQSGSEHTNQVVVKEDEQGNPFILFVAGAGSGPDSYKWKFARWNGNGWEVNDITFTDHLFDAGTFEVTSSEIRAYLVVGGTNGTGNGDGDHKDRGGNIEEWISYDGGITWSKVSPIIKKEDTGSIYNDPQIVSNYHPEAKLIFCEWDNDATNFIRKVFLYGSSGFVKREFSRQTQRVFGDSRIETAVEIAKKSFPAGSEYVFLATASNYPDALAGVPLAYIYKAPLLLTWKDDLPEEVASEINRLGAKKAVILGGTVAISNEVRSQLLNETSVTQVERIGGGSRYDTARLIASKIKEKLGDVNKAIITTGENFPDALAISPYAAYKGYPILLTRKNSLPEETEEALNSLDVTSTIIVGGLESVSSSVEDLLPSPQRIAGLNRYDTAARVADYAGSDGLSFERVLISTGENYPDALAGGVLGARFGAPLLLTRSQQLPSETRILLEGKISEILDFYILGGELAVSDDVQSELENMGK